MLPFWQGSSMLPRNSFIIAICINTQVGTHAVKQHACQLSKGDYAAVSQPIAKIHAFFPTFVTWVEM